MDWTGIVEAEKDIYIYGAGKYGMQVYRYLWLSGVGGRVKGFVVSDRTDNGDEVYGIPVIEFDNEYETIRQGLVILAMGKTASSGVYSGLKDEFKNITYVVAQGDYLQLEDLIIEECCKRPIKPNRVMFSCFMGRGYTCNCKYIAEKLKKTDGQVEIVWELSEETVCDLPQEIKTVLIGSPEYYLYWYTSKVIVCNSGLNGTMRKRHGQYIIDTWHGIGPTKKMGVETERDKDKPEVRAYFERVYDPVNLMTAASDLCVRNYRKAFLYKGEILKCGYPRNDIFFRADRDELGTAVREGLRVAEEELMVLYAPTYRYEQRTGGDLGEMRQKYELTWDDISRAFAGRFKKKTRLVYRFHHVTDRGLNIHNRYPGGIDATDYPDMQELLLAADILITDYSSSMWDFSLQRKPVFLYYNDADDVGKEVGFYRHPDTYPYPKGHTTEELCQAIICFDDDKYQRDLDVWFKEYGSYDDGHASERVVDWILDVIEKAKADDKMKECSVTYIDNLAFKSRRSVNWDTVEKKLRGYIGTSYEIYETSESVIIGNDFPDEFTHSNEKIKTKGANEKARANIICAIEDIIRTASNKRIVPDYEKKHGKKAEFGWCIYDTHFAIPEYNARGIIERYNIFKARMIVRHAADGKKYLYDYTRIKKEGVQPAKE